MKKIDSREEAVINFIIENYNSFSEEGKNKIRSFIEGEYFKEIFNNIPIEVEEWWSEEDSKWIAENLEWSIEDVEEELLTLCDNCKEKV